MYSMWPGFSAWSSFRFLVISQTCSEAVERCIDRDPDGFDLVDGVIDSRLELEYTSVSSADKVTFLRWEYVVRRGIFRTGLTGRVTPHCVYARDDFLVTNAIQNGDILQHFFVRPAGRAFLKAQDHLSAEMSQAAGFRVSSRVTLGPGAVLAQPFSFA